MWQTGTDEVVFVEHCYMFNYVVEFSQKSILDKFRLEETSFVDWAIEKSIKAHIPEEIRTVLLREEILWEISSKITKLILEQENRVSFLVIFN